MFSRFSGCLLGGAVGDALGAGVEFLGFSEIRRFCGPGGVTGYVEFDDNVGRFTDDTQMALFTAEALVRYEMSGLHWPGAGAEDSGASDAPDDSVARRARLSGQADEDRRLASIRAIGHRSYLRWLATQGREPQWEKLGFGPGEVLNGWLVGEPGLRDERAPGQTCLSALEAGDCGRPGCPVNDSKGCGGVMRVAPVGLWARDASEAFRVGCELAAITHGHPSGYLAAGCASAAISGLRDGRDLPAAISGAVALLREWPGHEECLEAVEAALDLARQDPEPSADRIRTLGGGWFGEEALAIGVYCALAFPGDFRRGVLAAVNHDGDSDSTAAVAGSLLGTALGREAIPREWVDNLELAWIVRQIAADLFAVTARRTPLPPASSARRDSGVGLDEASSLEPDPSLADRYPADF